MGESSRAHVLLSTSRPRLVLPSFETRPTSRPTPRPCACSTLLELSARALVDRSRPRPARGPSAAHNTTSGDIRSEVPRCRHEGAAGGLQSLVRRTPRPPPASLRSTASLTRTVRRQDHQGTSFTSLCCQDSRLTPCPSPAAAVRLARSLRPRPARMQSVSCCECFSEFQGRLFGRAAASASPGLSVLTSSPALLLQVSQLSSLGMLK